MKGKQSKTHGMSNTRFYRIWADMVKRCTNPKNIGYDNYGGRGISVCERWLISTGGSFENFYNDMFSSYEEGLSLERKDVNSGYRKDNCEWVDVKEQSKNKRGYCNNKLGIPNMKIINNKGVENLQVRLQNPENGKRVKKQFSLNKYTFAEANTLAKDWLNKKRKEFGYKESHGNETKTY